MSRARRSVGLQFLHDRYIGDDPAKIHAFKVARNNLKMAISAFQLRVNAALKTPVDLKDGIAMDKKKHAKLEEAHAAIDGLLIGDLNGYGVAYLAALTDLIEHSDT